MNNKLKKLYIQCDVIIPDNLRSEQFVHIMADYLKVNRFVLEVGEVAAYPINTKLVVTDISLPDESIQ
jgi:hypothetical protein